VSVVRAAREVRDELDCDPASKAHQNPRETLKGHPIIEIVSYELVAQVHDHVDDHVVHKVGVVHGHERGRAQGPDHQHDAGVEEEAQEDDGAARRFVRNVAVELRSTFPPLGVAVVVEGQQCRSEAGCQARYVDAELGLSGFDAEAQESNVRVALQDAA